MSSEVSPTAMSTPGDGSVGPVGSHGPAVEAAGAERSYEMHPALTPSLRLGLLRCDDPVPELRSICGTYSDMFVDVIGRVDPSVQMDTFSLPDGQWPSDLDAYDGWMTTGTRASVYDDEPWINQFADFVRQLHAERRKMFGVCFGHQMIAHALGGTVQRAPHGWTVGANVWKLHEHRSWMDPPSDEIRLIHSHQDQVLSLPPGGVVLAGADRCPIAMLAVGEHLVGLQGHPEFQPSFVGPLYESRTALLGEEAVAQAKASLAVPCNQELAATWMLRFFAGPAHSSRSQASAACK